MGVWLSENSEKNIQKPLREGRHFLHVTGNLALGDRRATPGGVSSASKRSGIDVGGTKEFAPRFRGKTPEGIVNRSADEGSVGGLATRM